MFIKPISQIEYSNVEAFCSKFGEGVRVEYKREMIEDIPKTISAFANTLGGIIVIGAETDKTQNRVIAINGIDKKAGIEERIIDSSLNGIYPSVVPEVKIFEIPSKQDKVLVIIKVHESIEAPHAIQNSTRVYIRAGSRNQPYELALAEIDRIEYMLKRREKPQKRKEELILRACNRVASFLGVRDPQGPYLNISISPVFPYQPLISLDELYTFCNGVPYNSSAYPDMDNPQRIRDGVCKFSSNANYFLYKEINHYGLIFVSRALEKIKPRRNRFGQDGTLYILFSDFVCAIGKALRLAKMFYDKCGYPGNVEVIVDVKNITRECLIYNEERLTPLSQCQSLDNDTSSSEIIMADDIESKLLDIVTSLTRNILWIFNVKADPQDIVEKILIEIV